MSKIIKILISTILLTVLLFNNICFAASWGVDETGKYSFEKITVVVKKQYSNDDTVAINHLKTLYPFNNIKIISEKANTAEESELILLISHPFSDEEEFNKVITMINEDYTVDAVLKNYYMTPADSYMGDITKDGVISLEDACSILKIAAGINKTQTETDNFLADVNNDGLINVEDARIVLKKSCGII